jgi:hypothetical protein
VIKKFLDYLPTLFHLEEWAAGPVSFADAFHVVGIQDDLGVGRISLRDQNGIDRTNRIANGATNATVHINLMLEIKIRDGINRTESTATTTIDTSLLIDVIVKLAVLHRASSFIVPRF